MSKLTMTKKDENDKKNSKKNKIRLYKPKKKKSTEEGAAIQYLQAQYEKIVPDEIKTFKDFPISQKTLKGLKDNNYIIPTEIQRQAIGYALQGKDILGAAKTGSGKTLAFLVPILELLFCKKWTRYDGVGAIVISPTRELAYQIYETLRKIGHYHDFSAGLIIGGQNLKFERKRMDQINILICTPGRLLQHMDENPLFNCHQMQILVLDEADRCLDLGFAQAMNAIIENLPTERQTLLFSATQTKSVKDLARLSLSFPTYVAPHEQADTVTPESLQQSYIVCDLDEKMAILWSFIRNHLKQKVLVFMATCKQVKYTYQLFCKLRPGVSLLALYGSLHQEKREKIYNEFCRKSNVVLFATDLASRGLDFPRVNWVIQMDCPEDVETYIHRAGRTARGVFGKGEGLLMLLPHEEKIVEDLKKSKIPINKIAIDPSKVVLPEKKIEGLVSFNSDLKKSAQRAFISYVRSVFLMKNKDIFNVQLLDTDAYGRSLGLVVPPSIKFLHRNNKNVIETQKENDKEDDDLIDKLNAAGKIPGDSESDHDNDIVIENTDDLKEIKKRHKKKLEKFEFHKSDVDHDNFIQVTKLDVNVEGDIVEPQEIDSIKKTKSLSEEAVVRNMLKNQVNVNTKVKFTEEGDTVERDTVEDETEDVMSYFGNQIENENIQPGLYLEKTKETVQEEDKVDKMQFREKVQTKHREKKRKLKNKKKEDVGEKDDFGSQSESDGPDLSWLPDPDQVYGKADGSDEESDYDGRDISDDDESSEEEEEEFYRPTKRKLLEKNSIPPESVVPRKIKKVEDISKTLSVQEAEALAMQLLQKK
nr:unnamed protein product [Amyelois transitella]